MKITGLNILVLMLPAMVVCSFGFINDGAIQGKIKPANGAQMVFVAAGRDTISAQVSNGAFLLPKVKPGTYSLLVRGIPPLRDTTILNVAVIEGSTTDIGEIKLLP